MPKVKYDVSNVDDAGGFEHVQPGMYIGKISEINLKDSKSGNGPMLEVILQPVKTADGKAVKPIDKKKQVARVYTYVLLEHEPSSWKLKEFVNAVGLKSKGMIDTDKLVDQQVQMNLKPDTDLNDAYRPRVGKLMAMPAGSNSRAAATVTEVEDEEDDEGVGEEYTHDDLDEMEDDELVEAASEFDIEEPRGRMTPVKRKKLIDAILAAQQEEAEDEDEDEDEESEEEGTDEADEEEADEEEAEEDEEEAEEEGEDEDLETALADMDRTELKAYIKENDLEIRVMKSMEDEDIREAIIEAVGVEEEDEDEPVDYDAWSIDALKKEAQERGLSTKGSKKIIAGRLSKDDEDEDNPF